MDALLFFFGKKVPLSYLYLSYTSGADQKLKIYLIMSVYKYNFNNKEYVSNVTNFSYYASSTNQDKVIKKINSVKNNQYAYVLPHFPNVSCIMPFYYSKFLFFMMLIGPVSLFFFEELYMY